MALQQIARTRYIGTAKGNRFAYRWLDHNTSVPLVMRMHFGGNMDFWDPALINGLAAARPVIVFDQAGVGRSTGTIPTTNRKADSFGFSMGGAAAQMVALTAPDLIRKLVLAGTTPSEPSTSSNLTGIVWPRDVAPREPIKVLANAFFPHTDEGRAAAKAYWSRISERDVVDEPCLLEFVDRDTGAMSQRAAYAEWSKPNGRNSFDRLRELRMPTLVMNGDDDLLIPTSRSWEMSVKIQNVQLIIYPRAGHGFLCHYPELVARHINLFLDGETGGTEQARL